MKLSIKTCYGTRALLDIVQHSENNSPVHVKDIASRQNISLSYLESIITTLVSASIVHTSRGVKGGVFLARPASTINLKQVVELLEGEITISDCLQPSGSCRRSAVCATKDIWGDIAKAIDGVLISVTLEDLAEKQRNKTDSNKMYCI